MNVNEYQQLASRTECDQRAAAIRREREDKGTHGYGATYGPHPVVTRLSHAALGISGEAGELCGALERWLHYGQPLDKVNVAEELGDLMWYVALACNALGLSLEDVMEANIHKLKQRYPDKYTDEHALEENRDRDAERKTLQEELPAGEVFQEGDSGVSGLGEASLNDEGTRSSRSVCQSTKGHEAKRKSQRSVEYENGDKQ